MKKIKVLQLHSDYNIKKYAISDLGELILKALPKERFETTTAFFSGKPKVGQPESVADHTVYFDFSKSQLKGLRLGVLFRLYRWLSRERFDVVICNRYKPVSTMLTLSRFVSIPKCIAVVHGFGDYDRLYRKKHLARNLSSSWTFVGVSKAVSEYLCSLNSGLNEENTIFINNAIDLEAAQRLMMDSQAARKELGLNQESVIVGAMGRLIPLKAHESLIRAFSSISKKHPEAQLAILGEGRERERLEGVIVDLNLIGKVHLLGFKEDAMQYLKAFDVWAMPSRTEGLSLALLEGMCAGLPVIASSIPALEPFVKAAGGVVHAPGDIAGIAGGLSYYLSLQPDERKRLGEKVFEYVSSAHDVGSFQSSYLQLVDSNNQIKM